MSEFWRTKNFRILNKEWNEKLKSSEFEDAEVELKGDRSLKQKATNCYRGASQLERETRLEYYVLMGHLANNTIFPNELEKLVMLRHSEGAMIREILEEISRQGISRNRLTIRYIIRRWQMKWGVKNWSLKDLRLKKNTG